MEVWAVIVIIILLIGIGGFAGLTYWTEHENARREQENILYPFSGTVDPGHTGNNVVLKKSTGDNQIQCPVGYNVNIVGAWVEVNDPFGECSPSPNSTFRATCGDDSDTASLVDCKDSGQCASGMECIEGKCTPQSCSTSNDCGGYACPVNPGKECKSNGDCGGSPMECVAGTCEVRPGLGQCMFCKNGRCAQAPTCSNLNDSYQNNACASENTMNQCRPRDASAYLAKECDGKQSCTVVWDPSSTKFFGPLPCKVGVRDNEYSRFPIVPGWGGQPPPGKGPKPASPSYNSGYYVHGLFSCVSSGE